MQLWLMTEKAINLLVGVMEKIGWVLILYCMSFGVADVFLRYVLNDPSLWISTTVQFAMVLMACVGGLYALDQDAFVRLDLFYANFSPRKKAICDIITSAYTMAFLFVLIWKGIAAAKLSLMLNQMTPTSVPLPLYPLKIFIPVTGVMVLLVVIKKLVNDLRTLHRESRQ